MSKVDQYSRRIANYIYNDMKSSEREDFERDLLNDPELAKEFKLQVSAIDVLSAKSVLEDLRSRTDLEEAERIFDEYLREKQDQDSITNQQSDQTNIEKQSTRFVRIKRILYPVLAAAVILAGVLIVRTISVTNLNERLFNEYYQPLDEVNFTDRGENEELYLSFRNAINFYHNGDYTSSTSILSELSKQNPNFTESHFYLALSKIGEKQHATAANYLENYLLEFNKYQPEAKWYLAMCYIKLNRITEANELMIELAGLGGAYGRNAEEILRKLDRVVE